MDINSGRLVKDINALPVVERDAFMPVPAYLREDAERALAGRRETVINLNAQSNLAEWAAKKRKADRTRNKIAKKSRARNRK